MALRLSQRFDTLPQPAILAVVYAVWIVTGVLLLKLPFSTTDTISWSDALFTATSAVTVTGLVVLDTGSAFTSFGQGMILLLMQLGGMGLMCFAVLILSSLGFKVGLSEQRYLKEEMGLSSLGSVFSLAIMVFRVVLITELIGAALLSVVFVPEAGWSAGIWLAVFHSVSAFNNAGFSLFPDSLVSYQSEPLVLGTIAFQFIIGGLGFAVISDLWHRRNGVVTSLHTRLMVTGTVGLIVVGMSMYAVLEWNNPDTLGDIDSVGAKLLVAFFEGVTPRTAGFNATDTSAMHESTTLFTMVMMVIGGGSTSTAGGIKVTTFMLLLLATLAFFRSTGSVRAFGYSVGPAQSLKVMALLTMSLFVILSAFFVLLVTQDSLFVDLAFETTSAFGTVGLSRGATGELDNFGRLVICVVMFLGRVGPLSLGFFLASQVAPRVKYPEGEIIIG